MLIAILWSGKTVRIRRGRFMERRWDRRSSR